MRGSWTIPDRHMPYIWAAYVRGVFGKFESFPEDLEPGQFQDRMTALLRAEINRGNQAHLGLCRTPQGEIPIGLFFTSFDGEFIHPDVFWFPEASPRNRLEAAARYILEFKDKNMLLWLVQPEDSRFMFHLGRYGLTCRVGTLRGYSGNRLLFQSVRKEK